MMPLSPSCVTDNTSICSVCLPGIPFVHIETAKIPSSCISRCFSNSSVCLQNTSPTLRFKVRPPIPSSPAFSQVGSHTLCWPVTAPCPSHPTQGRAHRHLPCKPLPSSFPVFLLLCNRVSGDCVLPLFKPPTSLSSTSEPYLSISPSLCHPCISLSRP